MNNNDNGEDKRERKETSINTTINNSNNNNDDVINNNNGHFFPFLPVSYRNSSCMKEKEEDKKKPEIRIGESFQAQLPQLLSSSQYHQSLFQKEEREEGTLLWDPHSIPEFIWNHLWDSLLLCSKSFPSSSRLSSSSIIQPKEESKKTKSENLTNEEEKERKEKEDESNNNNNIEIENNLKRRACVKDLEKEKIYYWTYEQVHCSSLDISSQFQLILDDALNKKKFVVSTKDDWNDVEQLLFSSLCKQTKLEKDFHSIKQLMGTKNCQQLIEYYYSTKRKRKK
eukprot:TRINITY_DN9114_c0_g1_i1.p1 TRINITY_DN9114_c0_g1~~TRINITY_DN9114_c0_g1_i1.p1  ORF type:complete len:283 (-),score=107.45 TRINITY_DN9114_c0_g1_i1:50-898(-)